MAYVFLVFGALGGCAAIAAAAMDLPSAAIWALGSGWNLARALGVVHEARQSALTDEALRGWERSADLTDWAIEKLRLDPADWWKDYPDDEEART